MEASRDERLRQLRRVVEAAPDNELFDMAWVAARKDCGTSHCAYGWARIDPWFIENTEIATTGFSAVRNGVFNLSVVDFDNLFQPGDDNDLLGPEAKRLVIANIDRILAGYPAIPYPGKQ